MSSRALTIAVALGLLVGVPLGTADPSSRYWNDAGSGVDAGNDRASALALAAHGSYGGYRLPWDEDWFKVAEQGLPTCVVADVTSAVTGQATLELVSPGERRSVTETMPAGRSTRIAIAAPAASQTFFGIASAPPSYGDHGSYAFTTSARTTAGIRGDAGTNGDVGGTAASAHPVSPGCTAGTLSPAAALGDKVDAYAFSGSAGDVVVLSFAAAPTSTPMRLELTDGLTTLATLSPGQLVVVTLPASGTYTMTTSAGDLTSVGETLAYLVGLVVGPPGSPCRPQCIYTE